MAFFVEDLLWDDWNREHIDRHGVSPDEVQDVCFGQPWILRAKGKDKRAAYGQTSGGRYLLVILGVRGAGRFYPITARDMSESERRRSNDGESDRYDRSTESSKGS